MGYDNANVVTGTKGNLWESELILNIKKIYQQALKEYSRGWCRYHHESRCSRISMIQAYKPLHTNCVGHFRSIVPCCLKIIRLIVGWGTTSGHIEYMVDTPRLLVITLEVYSLMTVYSFGQWLGMSMVTCSTCELVPKPRGWTCVFKYHTSVLLGY